MTWAVALAAVLAFVVLADRLGVPSQVRTIFGRGRATLAILRDLQLDDASKERAMRAQARSLLGLFVRLSALSILALALPAAAVWLLVVAGLVDGGAVLATAASWSFLLAATVLVVATAPLLRRRRP